MHVRTEKECKNSGLCIWEIDKCIIKPGQSYNTEMSNSNKCKRYAQEDCRQQEFCGFYFGQCIDFDDCIIFDKDSCQESSYKCVSDGSKCVQIQECSDYKTENGCANINKYNKYCFWIGGIQKQCLDVITCEGLPIYLNNHQMCESGLKGCTISENGYGCINQMEFCSQYANNFQCFQSKKNNCYWDQKNEKCVEKVCENLLFTQDYECKGILSDCTTNGVHCVKRRQCSDAQSISGCVTDLEGKKCEYHQNQCKIKSCSTAPDSLRNYQQCQDYDNLLDCVTSENKGCKTRPETCYGYTEEMDCYSVTEQDCIWYQNKCEQRQCYHAPDYFTHEDCHFYGNCIGKLNGGCQMTPQLCEEILDKQFCEINYNKEKCIWLEGKCELLQCKKLKLPTYKNHQICQNTSQYCTFNVNTLGCTDYICENILEIEYCTIDSNGTVCTLNQGCIEKNCNTAPPYYDSNSKCEEWMPKCTVNVQQIQNSKILIGCIDKKNSCELSNQDQCYSTISELQCKWDEYNKRCINQQCTDASVLLYLTNEDCQQFKVLYGPCIIRYTGAGCQQWPTDCTQMMSINQCQLNLQDGTNCFWTGTKCKKQECSDAPKVNYTNNVECNTWLKTCIFDHSLGGCKDRPNSLACSSSPNDVMYNNHQECFAWNPKCTVISSFKVEGCESKKANCHEFIRQRNCKTNKNGQFCYWDDKLQKCMNEGEDNNGVADCDKRLYGDLTHQDCEDFLPKCTIKNIGRSCQSLLQCSYYKYQQQCVIDAYLQPCKWDNQNQTCKSVDCVDNNTAQTEAECLRFRYSFDCQLKINPNGTYGPGCEKRPRSCGEVTNPVVCKLTMTYSFDRCYFIKYNSTCSLLTSSQCELIESQSNEICQLYNSYCVLQPSGQGCHSIYVCNNISSQVCNNALMKYNDRCIYQDKCNNDVCSSRQLSSYSCSGQKTSSGIKCSFIQLCYSSGACEYKCVDQTNQIYLYISSSATLDDKRKQCQNYSSTYRYDTSCSCCVILTSCSFQVGSQYLCNSSITQNGQKCGYNQSNNTCEDRICSHLNSTHNLSQLICYNWGYNCVYDVTGCKTFSGDCSTIGIIQQCYTHSCYWQDNKCVNYLNCDLNTTAVTNRECLLSNSLYCKLNYTQGYGCAFRYCSYIKEAAICNSAKIADGQRCYWINNYCNYKRCSDHTIQSDCQNSYGFLSPITSKCYWCSLNTIKCSNNKYCSLTTITSLSSHEDCNNNNFFSTIYISMSSKCTLKQQLCQNYTYKLACVKTINNVGCYWNSNACINYCDAAVQSITTWTHSSCQSWNSSCMSLNEAGCQLLDCQKLIIEADCVIFSTKCFWDGSTCQTIGDCSRYFDNSLCLDKINSQGIPCFWDDTDTKCLEKTCSNKPSSSNDQTECNSWLTNCQWNKNNNQCVEDCAQADISNNTHTQCESYYSNKSCTVKVDIIQCVDLPFSCSLAKETQCYKDQFGNECYYQDSLKKCVNLLCSNLESSFNTHEKCNSRLKACTVNEDFNGCQQLNNCGSYSNPEQCKIDSNNVECEWIINSNTCTIKQCSTAQLKDYSAHSCHQYFGDSCTINDALNGCEIGQSQCSSYTYNQCNSEGQMNLSAVSCFWDEEKSICMERICRNGPSLAQSHADCIGFLSTCQKSSCRRKECFDYNYAIDSACASIFEDKRCATNGYQCILRGTCEDITASDGCTFDINLNPCVWINQKCYTKSCDTASISITEYLECNAYFPGCTAKQGGGCTKKQKQACYTDSENQECIWDDYLNQCFSNQCIDSCGDGIISSKEEECDDGNYLPYDGCYKCQIQCPLGCNSCNGWICEECQKKGWLLINGICTSICGDGYITGQEQCDDGNQIEFDGCFDCTYSCHQKCLNCFQGLCVLCEDGYLEDGSQCFNICGDGLLIKKLEQCDDGNIQNNDGCSNTCEVEDNWKCQQENNISVCKYNIQPAIILTKISKSNTDNQEFRLSFSEQVRLNVNQINEEQFLQMIVVTIENTDDSEYDVEIKPIVSISPILADVSYKIIVYFNSNLSNPLIKVTIRCENIVNIQDNTLFSNEANLLLKSPNKMSQDRQSIISKTALLSKIVMYIILIVSGIAFCCGNLEILWNLLDMLQQLSYMKFHNLQFPENLQIYFEIFTIGDFTPIVNFFQIDTYLEELFDFQIPTIPAKWKFESYKLNCYFLKNLQTFVVILIIGFAYYIFSYFFYKFLIIIKYYNWPAIFYNHYDKFFRISRSIFSLQKLARRQYQYFIYSGLIRIFTSNFYELTFASILQIANYNTDDNLNATISLLALIVLQINLFLIILFFSYLSKKDEVPKVLKVLVEGINNNFKQVSKQYFTILLIKKTLFIVNLVLLQDLQGAQCLITGCLSGTFALYIQIYKPFKNNYENKKILNTELLIMLNVQLFSVYDIIKFNQDKSLAEILGWINIGGFTLILIVTLAIDIYQQLQKYICYWQQKQLGTKKNKTRKGITNNIFKF
ncbi:unnamed protein product [Paramecium octaurelia]|uniref:Uncharacterized protein n=1 Tax=Paramecium octaurelia TaxID=43137 RepID=A0A8S1WDT0_PAROT|nr:unnamed protein product [Paramecium octaurelia]